MIKEKERRPERRRQEASTNKSVGKKTGRKEEKTRGIETKGGKRRRQNKRRQEERWWCYERWLEDGKAGQRKGDKGMERWQEKRRPDKRRWNEQKKLRVLSSGFLGLITDWWKEESGHNMRWEETKEEMMRGRDRGTRRRRGKMS